MQTCCLACSDIQQYDQTIDGAAQLFFAAGADKGDAVGFGEAGEDLGEAVVAQAHFDLLERGNVADDLLDEGAAGFAVELDVAVGDEQDVVDPGGGDDGGGAHAGAQLGDGGVGHDFDFVGDDAADVACGGRNFDDLAGDVGVGEGVEAEADGLADLDLADV